MEKLKPCPFCGSKAEFYSFEKEITCKMSVEVFDVQCTNTECYLCDGAEWEFDSEEEAAELWNKRKENGD